MAMNVTQMDCERFFLNLTINFDVVCSSEISQQSDQVFPKNGTLITMIYRIPPLINIYLYMCS